MNPRFYQEQIGLFPATQPTPRDAAMQALRAQAAQARDAALLAGFRRALGSIGQGFAALGEALLSFPRRRGTYAALRQLSDRELADIGLTRGDIPRVFEPDFAMPAQPANANLPPARPLAA